MKQRIFTGIAFACALAALISCSKPVSDAELKQAYLFYIEAPTTLTKVISTANTESLIAETLSDESGSYTRSTEINQADKRAKITSTFKEYHPVGTEAVTIDGEVILTSRETMFFLNGGLSYKGIKPAKLTFKNIQLEQQTNESGTFFYPLGGYALADKREITSEILFTSILK